MYRNVKEPVNDGFFKIVHFTVTFLFYQNNVSSFSKHTFSLSIFRTVTCNKVIKERRRSCVFVSDSDLGKLSLSGSEKNLSSPLKRALLLFVSFKCAVEFELISVLPSVCWLALSLIWKPASALPVPALQWLQRLRGASEEERDGLSSFRGGRRCGGGGWARQEAVTVVSRAELLRGEAAAFFLPPRSFVILFCTGPQTQLAGS